ncbi:UDP-N-acetylmuramoyl-tripeptide--D-alanyl-D-alanine ligase [Neisseria sp. Ec49-e6-T10]|uniref:UDP-N-acetylmuramoyl-tripeptide--D-alanyl-D- alanine ligase n=1 Tax=Neisseria sp. Ec49-e6-T10 TaxID=3140744 RepID=UPI003EBFBFF8
MNLDLNFIYQALGQEKPIQNSIVHGISTDSRKVTVNDVFFALKGAHFDGHQFVSEVLAKGAVAAVVCCDFEMEDPRLIKVDDTLQALGTLAHQWRKSLNLTLLGITGSSGKTTVKEMVLCILKEFVPVQSVLATEGNFNNEIGLPLTLLKLTPEHRFAVIEMGMNHFGELTRLTQIAQPDIALVNNAQRAHIGCGFDSVADIAKAKSEIYIGLSESGVGIYPQEDQYANIFKAAIHSQYCMSFGVEHGDVHAKALTLEPLSSQFILCTPKGEQDIHLPVAGKHNVSNACAASSLALCADVPLEIIAKALANFQNIKGRLQQKTGYAGSRIIDDTYNANPESVRAAIDVLSRFMPNRILILGDLGELGDNAKVLHQEIGTYAKKAQVDYLITLGDLSASATVAFGEQAKHFTQIDELVSYVRPLLSQDTNVLVKGSRFMKMERVVDALLACN